MSNTGSGLLTIGAFSRASLLSVRTLRKYHDADLLVPTRVDPATGYRAYHASQLMDATLIRRLRELELPLAQIREVLDARDPAVTRNILMAHARTMQDRLTQIGSIVATLDTDVDRPETRTPVHVRQEVAVPTLAVRGVVAEAEFDVFLGGAYARIHACAEELGVAPAGPDGALYPGEIADDGPVEVEAFMPLSRPLPLDGRTDGVITSAVAAAEVAAVVHEGDYESIGETYRLLGEWVAYHATPDSAAIREVYIVSYAETADAAKFRTEIQWPLRPSS